MTQLPKFFHVRQNFTAQALPDIAASVEDALAGVALSDKIQAEQTVAIGVGSRGIADIQAVVRSIVRYVQASGAKPFIVPAMGSHGGATAEGQVHVLESIGISEQTVGCPIRSSMETVVVGHHDGVPIYFDEISSRADHVILVNRVKPHTRLVGHIESGLCKMLMIGFGKHRGALNYHQAFANYDHRLDRIASGVVPTIVAQLPITLGIAIVEDAFDRASLIQAIEPNQLLTEEPRLLALARQRMPRLPFDHADLLIIDEIGKEISGSGMDTNVIGRKANDRAAAVDEYPKLRQIYVRSLTDKTNGNATGIGIAEFCRKQVVRDMNMEMTRVNCITSGHVSAGAIPVHFETDREVLDAALTQALKPTPEHAKWMWIPNTLRLSEVACSQAYLDEVADRTDLVVLDSPQSLVFDAKGDLAYSASVL